MDTVLAPRATGSEYAGLRRPLTLPCQTIEQLQQSGAIASRLFIERDQIQPASMDLRIGAEAWRIRSSFAPRANRPVAAELVRQSAYKLDLRESAVLEAGAVYIIPLLESLALPPDVEALANPKSTTGRLDVLVRVLTDSDAGFNRAPAGYHGPLWLEVAPRTFSITASMGDRLTQIRFQVGSGPAGLDPDILATRAPSLIGLSDAEPGWKPLVRDNLIGLSVDLDGLGTIVGYRGRRHADRIDLSKVRHYPRDQFWDAIHQPTDGRLILDPGYVYILATRENVSVPPDLAAEMTAYDASAGDFLPQAAGYFDPGFGTPLDSSASRAVLELRNFGVPFQIEHGQTIAWLRYDAMLEIPARLYGAGSNYQRQKLALAKHFL